MSKFKLNQREKAWILYDVGNSAFTMLVSTLIPIYFNALASSAGVSDTNYLAYWGYAGSIATLLTAIIGPVFGTLADRKNYKKPIFTIALVLGVVSCAALGAAWSWISFLVIFVFSKVCYSSSLVFYDAMLPETTTDDRMDNVSSQGYAFGYIGSCIPFIACLVIVLMSDKLGISQSEDLSSDAVCGGPRESLPAELWTVGRYLPQYSEGKAHFPVPCGVLPVHRWRLYHH